VPVVARAPCSNSGGVPRHPREGAGVWPPRRRHFAQQSDHALL